MAHMTRQQLKLQITERQSEEIAGQFLGDRRDSRRLLGFGLVARLKLLEGIERGSEHLLALAFAVN